jgi:hypothetical protein
MDGVVCYSKSFFGFEHTNSDILSFLTLITRVSKKIGGGNIRSLNFENFNFVYTYGNKNYVFIITTDIHDPEEEAILKLKLLKEEFFKRFNEGKEKWTDENSGFKEFSEFVESEIFLPPKILLVGEDGVGKKTIMDLFPGDTVLELDDNMTEVVEKNVKLSDLKEIKEFVLREINFNDLMDNFKEYRPLLETVDIMCMVTNSGAANLSRTKNLYSRLKERVKKVDYYIIANFQDAQNSAFEPNKISESFGLKTFGFSAIQIDAKEHIELIFKKILEISILNKFGKVDIDITTLKEIKK